MELRILVNNINIDEMTYAELVAFTSEADRPLLASSDTISYAKTMLGLSQKKGSPPQPKSPGTDSKNRQTYQPLYVKLNGQIYETLTDPPVWATQETRLKAIVEGLCGNCLSYKENRYPPHADRNCPFTLPSCQPRPGQGPFSPVAPLNNILPRASDDETVKAFIDERLEKLARHGKGSSKGGKGNQNNQPVTLQTMQVKSNDDIVIEEITTPEPLRETPTLPPSPWTHRGNLGWCNIACMHHITVKPHIPAFITTDVPGYAPPRPANIEAPIDLNTASLINASTDEMANYSGNDDNTLEHASASDDEMIALSALSTRCTTPHNGGAPISVATAALDRTSSPYERASYECLTTRAIQLGVTPDTLIAALYGIPDEYLDNILAPYKNDRGRSELIHNAPLGDRRLIIPMDVPTAVFNTMHIADIESDPDSATLAEARNGGSTAALHTVLTQLIDRDGRLEKLAVPTTSVPSYDPGGYLNKAKHTVTHASTRRHHAVECRSISEFSSRFITGAVTANHFQSNGSSQANKKSY